MYKEPLRRRFSAWVLLLAVVPLLSVPVLHRHHSVVTWGENCVQCAHHQPHTGHMGVASTATGDCLLCQYSNVSGVLPVHIDVQQVYIEAVELYIGYVCPIVKGYSHDGIPRAPPYAVST